MSTIFSIKNTDKRKQLIAKELKTSQQPSGKNVEYFSRSTGFVLLKGEAPIDYTKKYVLRAIAAARLSLKTTLELREFYYSLRTTPELVQYFKGVKKLYPAVLDAINKIEILCDIGRETFTIGNLSKGFIYYFHSELYSDKDRKIGFTENIARSVMTVDELKECENIIVVEKNSTANRLVDLGFSELTNSVIVTTGGYFNRAIWALTERFNNEKTLLFIADADAYGVDMLRTIEAGSEASRHLPFKFPSAHNPGIHLTGLFPSIGEDLGLPNDEEQKRPLHNPFVRKRIDFLVRHGLLNKRDFNTWMRDKTYELEALSASMINADNKPIGSAVYLVEYMRLMKIPVKPPLPPDEELEKAFQDAARKELEDELWEALNKDCPDATLIAKILQYFLDLKSSLLSLMYEKFLPALEEALKQVTAKEIKYHIYKQFEADPTRATYDLAAIAHKLKSKFDVTITWHSDNLEEAVQDAVDIYDSERPEDEEMVDTDVEFMPIHNETATQNPYDLILKRLGADFEDAARVREALGRRFAK